MRDLNMKLEWKITHLLHPHYVKDKGCIYDHIRWTIWFSRQDLMDDVNEKFNTHFIIENEIEVEELLAQNIWNYIRERKDTVGIYGDDYDKKYE